MSRPQVGIGRLPNRRASDEPKEAMNCNSCRKRKIKCNRVRPICEACQVFSCPCIYDAVPKKRGPKTDVLEALLKRVDGLEKRLQGENKPDSPGEQHAPRDGIDPQATSAEERLPEAGEATAVFLPGDSSQHMSGTLQDLLLDTYFSKVNAKPYNILDEATTRQRVQENLLPSHLIYAISAVGARYAFSYDAYNSADRTGEEYARRARFELDMDDPSVERLQTLLLLSQESFQAGKGRKAYMLLSMPPLHLVMRLLIGRQHLQ